MVLTLYVDYASQPCRAVALLLKLNQIQHDEKIVSLFKREHMQPEFLKVNPLHTVPTLTDDDFMLTESVAQMKYICTKPGVAANWYPTDVRQRARVDEFQAWHHSGLRAKSVGVIMEQVFKKVFMKMEPDPKIVAEKVAELDKVLDYMESYFLEHNDFLAGNEISIADLTGACEVMQQVYIGRDPSEGRPKLTAWLERVKKATNPHFDDCHNNQAAATWAQITKDL